MTGSNKQIQILAIAPYRFLPAITGGQKGIALFYKYLSPLVSLYCVSVKDMPLETKEGSYTVLPILSKSKLRYINPLYFFSLRKIIREKAITYILLEHPYYGWLGYLLKKVLKVRLIIHSHNIEGLRFKSLGKWWWRILLYYEKQVYRSADINFFITEEEKKYATRHFRLSEDKCITVTYGTGLKESYTREEKADAKKIVCHIHDINEKVPVLFFNAAFNYIPNRKALDDILHRINPLLLQSGLSYHILICGPDLPAAYQQLAFFKDKNITYAGFVDDINLYFKAADIFLNPISEGGGIKTKLVEALAANTSAISYKSGAHGVPVSLTGKKLHIANDNDAYTFAGEIQSAICTIGDNIPPDFFRHFYWGNIARKAVEKMEALR